MQPSSSHAFQSSQVQSALVHCLTIWHRDECKNGGISRLVPDNNSPDYSTRPTTHRKVHARGNAYALRRWEETTVFPHSLSIHQRHGGTMASDKPSQACVPEMSQANPPIVWIFKRCPHGGRCPSRPFKHSKAYSKYIKTSGKHFQEWPDRYYLQWQSGKGSRKFNVKWETGGKWSQKGENESQW